MAKDSHEAFVSHDGEALEGVKWSAFGQAYYPRSRTKDCFVFETVTNPREYVPVHVHSHQDEFMLVLEGAIDVKLDGAWRAARPGDLVTMPRGVPHGYYNKSQEPVRALFWVTPAGSLEAFFEAIEGIDDIARIVAIAADHGLQFLPPETNG